MENERDYLWLHLRDLPYFRAILRAVEARFFQDYPLTEPVLDIGCGDGHFASVTFSRKLSVGLDPSLKLLQQAQQGCGYHTLVQADGGWMPFPDGFFASALSNSVLEHIPHVRSVLFETARVLQPGAIFLFSVPNPRYLSELSIPGYLKRLGLTGLAQRYTDWFQRMSRVEHAESPQVWADWLGEAGFHLEKWWDYFPPQAMHALEWGHYFGAPTLLPHAIFGRWILVPSRWNLALTEYLVRGYAQAQPHPQGAFTFYVARRIGSKTG